MAQAQQSAGCNARHTVESRMCRWLLRLRDLTRSDSLKLKQEFLAQMLGVRRTSVALVAESGDQATFQSPTNRNCRYAHRQSLFDAFRGQLKT